MSTADVARDYLLYFILPLWLATGVCDWFCHRHAKIETSAGPKESVIHLLMMAQGGVAVLAGLFFEINSLIILTMVAAWALHEATSMWDLIYANAERKVGPVEQRVHDYLAVIPLLALSFILVLNWGQFLAIFGLGDAVADWALRPRRLDVSPIYYWGLLAIMFLVFALFVEELLRGLRASARR